MFRRLLFVGAMQEGSRLVIREVVKDQMTQIFMIEHETRKAALGRFMKEVIEAMSNQSHCRILNSINIEDGPKFGGLFNNQLKVSGVIFQPSLDRETTRHCELVIRNIDRHLAGNLEADAPIILVSTDKMFRGQLHPDTSKPFYHFNYTDDTLKAIPGYVTGALRAT